MMMTDTKHPETHISVVPAPKGAFLGTEVHAGRGGGLASSSPTPSGSTTHFHAARLPELGDVVLTVTRSFDVTTTAALGIELRAFAASAPGRGALAKMDPTQFFDAPGAIAIASIRLSSPGDFADDRRAATLQRCVVTDAAPTASAARGIADWLRATWETELAFGAWPAITGTLDAFALHGGASADWTLDWLVDREHKIDDAERPATFLKVMSGTWLDSAADAPAHAASASQ